MFSPNVCYQKLLEIVHREEEKVNWILSAKVVFLNSEKGPRDRYKLPALRHFTPFKKDAKKWRGNRENLVSNLESRWSVLVEGRALKMLLYRSSLFRCKSFHIISNTSTSRKNQISQKRYRLSNRLLQCPFPRRSNLLVAWVSHDFRFVALV